jgi:hypothetical protein
MKDLRYAKAIIAIAFFFSSGMSTHAATLSIDLDLDSTGIQTSSLLSPGETLDFRVVYTGDGTTQFDTFALDVVYETANTNIFITNPVAGAIVDSAPMLALDIYNATPVSSGDPLDGESMPPPLGYVSPGLAVGVSSVGGMPFSLVEDGESVDLFSASMRVSSFTGEPLNLALTGYPFGIGAELSLAGRHIPVNLQEATIRVIPLPAAFWLFASGVVALLGMRKQMD